ncbi:MAG: hypothetical protein JO083_05685 [Candidatus Eremiobacteraeota bacterium]|nr:hypothetical protein [Candidatus Eremiobacteraeota bacterium]
MRFSGWSALALVALALAACSGGGATTFPPAVICNVPAFLGEPEYLIYPAPGSTGIPDNVQTVVLSRFTGKVTLIPATGTPVVSTSPTPVPSPIPAPNAAQQHTAGAAFSVAPLAPAMTYQVWAQDVYVPAPCAAVTAPTLLGSFTTQ